MYRTTYANDDDLTIKVGRQKPRAKQLNAALLDRPAGRMKSPKDNSRVKQKQDLRRMMESDE